MIKKLLKKFISIFSYQYDRNQIEEYLAKSTDLADLENRMAKLDKDGIYNQFYI